MMNIKYKLAILASGKGSTAEALFELSSLVVVSSPDAGIIKRVEDFNKNSEKKLKLIILDRSKFESRESFGEELIKILKEDEIDFVSQNGWTVYTPNNVLNEYAGKIINAHPGPLDPRHPDFGGGKMNDLVVHQAVINFSKKIQRPFKTEITLHQTTNEYDKGEVVANSQIEISPDETADSLQQKVKEEEKKLLKSFWTKVLETGEIPTTKRSDRVIKSGEEKFLEEAKQEAIALYGTSRLRSKNNI